MPFPHSFLLQEYAIDPPVTLAPWEKSYHFLCTAHRIVDPKAEHLRAQSLEKWTKEDKIRFKERFLATPKNFTTIAASLDKTVAECIHYYYLSKKAEDYKGLVKKHSTSRRRRAGHSDKNGPTGPSHGTASKKAPSRVSTPGGAGAGGGGGDEHRNSPHPECKVRLSIKDVELCAIEIRKKSTTRDSSNFRIEP